MEEIRGQEALVEELENERLWLKGWEAKRLLLGKEMMRECRERMENNWEFERLLGTLILPFGMGRVSVRENKSRDYSRRGRKQEEETH